VAEEVRIISADDTPSSFLIMRHSWQGVSPLIIIIIPTRIDGIRSKKFLLLLLAAADKRFPWAAAGGLLLLLHAERSIHWDVV